MMKTIFVTLLLLLAGLHSKAQLSYGLKFGLNFSRVLHKQKETEPLGFSPSVHFGAYGNIAVSKHVYFSGDFLLSDKGYHENTSAHLLYLNIPLLVNYKPIKNLSFGLGPYLGVLITPWGKDREGLKEVYSNRLDVGSVIGVQYAFNSAIAVAFRFEQGFSNIIGRNAEIPMYQYISEGDPVITSMNLRKAGFSHRNQNFQFSVCYSLK